VEATADYNPDTREFILNTVEEGSAKNWISSGLVADKTVVVANLRLKGKSYGPHAFLIDMRRNGLSLPLPLHKYASFLIIYTCIF
jgi:acyl-CoA oxidase